MFKCTEILVLLLLVFVMTIPCMGASNTKEYFLEKGQIKTEAIEPKNEKIEVNISVVNNGSEIDIYIMRLEDYSKNMFLKNNFTNETLNYTQKVRYWNITFIPPDDENYVIVLDNSDNFRNNDTIPVNDVLVSINIHYTKSAASMTFKGIIISFIALVFIALTLRRYHNRRNEWKKQWRVRKNR